MDDLLKGSETLFNEIKEHKELKKKPKNVVGLAKKKTKKYFGRWSS